MSDNFKILLFCFYTFGDRGSIDVLDPENQPGSGNILNGSGALGLIEGFKICFKVPHHISKHSLRLPLRPANFDGFHKITLHWKTSYQNIFFLLKKLK